MKRDSSYPSAWQRYRDSNLHQFFLREFTWSSLGFKHFRHNDFFESQWLIVKPWLFTIYRVVLAILMLAWVSWDIPRETHRYFQNRSHIWFLYATNWAFGCLALVFFLLAVYSLIYNCPRREESTGVLYQPIWLFYTIIVNQIIVVSFVFWVALSNSNLRVFASVWGRLKHSLAAVLAIFDFGISAIPIRLIHIVYPILAGALYCVFSYVFWLNRGDGPIAVGQVYPGLNWKHPRTAILACLCVLAITCFVHILLYLTYFLRIKLSIRVEGREQQKQPILKLDGNYTQIDKNDNPVDDDLISVASTSTCVDRKTNYEYGTIE